MKSLSAILLSTLSLSLTTLCRAQGSLTPPPGPPAPTMKTLDQVEARTPLNATTAPGDVNYLFKITQPGSYYFTGNITGVSGKKGISITASGVVLDLNGFTLSGPAPGDNEDGIHINGDGVSVRNGTVSGWHRYGVMGGYGACFTQLTCTGNGHLESQFAIGAGISAAAGSTLVDCIFLKNPGNGCNAGFGGITLTRCAARGNGRAGIVTASAAILNQCTASTNGTGFNLGPGTVATGCCASENNDSGFAMQGVLVDCTAIFNKGHGIFATGAAKIQSCFATYNGTAGIGSGIAVSDHVTVENCSAENNQAHGISVGTHCSVRHSTAHANGSDGISAGIYATIEDCTANNNAVDGIRTAGGSVVKECTAMKNGTGGAAAGIHVTGSGSRIEGNSTRDNTGTGILATAGDLIMRNSSGVNSVANYNPASGAGFAPLQSPATQTNPNANF